MLKYFLLSLFTWSAKRFVSPAKFLLQLSLRGVEAQAEYSQTPLYVSSRILENVCARARELLLIVSVF